MKDYCLCCKMIITTVFFFSLFRFGNQHSIPLYSSLVRVSFLLHLSNFMFQIIFYNLCWFLAIKNLFSQKSLPKTKKYYILLYIQYFQNARFKQSLIKFKNNFFLLKSCVTFLAEKDGFDLKGAINK